MEVLAVSDELKMKCAMLEAFAAEFADCTIGETYELTSSQQRMISDGIRAVLAALAKREAVDWQWRHHDTEAWRRSSVKPSSSWTVQIRPLYGGAVKEIRVINDFDAMLAASQQAKYGDAQDQTDARDAERYRWLRENGKEMPYDALLEIIEEYGDRADAKLDAAMLAAKEKGND